MLALGKFVTIKNVYVRYKFQQRVSMGSMSIIIVVQKFIFLHAFFSLMMLYLYACPFGTFATKMAAYGHSTVLNRVIEVGGM